MILGQLVKMLRDEYVSGPLTQADIAKVLDASVMTVSRLEKGSADLSVSDLERLAEFFEIPADQLVKIALDVKRVLIEQKCLVLQNKHQLRKMREFKKLDRQIIYDLCKKIFETNIRKKAA